MTIILQIWYNKFSASADSAATLVYLSRKIKCGRFYSATWETNQYSILDTFDRENCHIRISHNLHPFFHCYNFWKLSTIIHSDNSKHKHYQPFFSLSYILIIYYIFYFVNTFLKIFWFYWNYTSIVPISSQPPNFGSQSISISYTQPV